MNELYNSQNNPILEAFYNTHTEAPTKLYDCLVPVITDLRKPSQKEVKNNLMPDRQSDLDEPNIRDLSDASNNDSVNYRRALALKDKEISILKG